MHAGDLCDVVGFQDDVVGFRSHQHEVRLRFLYVDVHVCSAPKIDCNRDMPHVVMNTILNTTGLSC